MRYENPPRWKKVVKSIARIGQKVRSAIGAISDPVGTVVDAALEQGAKLNTKQKRFGAIRRKVQYYDPSTQRFVKVDANTGKFEDVRSRKGVKWARVRMGRPRSSPSNRAETTPKSKKPSRKRRKRAPSKKRGNRSARKSGSRPRGHR
jgi:hypothetical protein